MPTPTYQGARNNDPESNSEPTRDLMLVNQPAGGIEFVNTKDDEMVTHYHKNGSFIRFHKFGTDMLHTLDKREHVQGDSRTEVNGNVVNIFHKDLETVHFGDKLNKTGDIDKWQPYMKDYKKLSYEIHQLKRLFELKRVKVHNFIDQAPDQTKEGALAPCPVEKTESKVLYTVNPTIYVPPIKAACAHVSMGLIDNEFEYRTVAGSGAGQMYEGGWDCFTCWGTGESPSTQDGSWSKEGLKDTITKKRIDIQEKMFDLEKHLGQNQHRQGGTHVDKIAKDYVGLVGLAMNDFESFRKDPKGKLVPYGVKVDPFGTGLYVQYRESSLVERVHVDKLPGGHYDLIVCGGYNLTVGSNGINMKTSGPMEVYAPIIDLVTEDITLNSRGEMRLGAERLDMSAEIITLRPKKRARKIEDAAGNNIPILPANLKDETEEEQQVLVDGNLQVAMNAVVAGGLHVEGELTVQHITAPLEYGITESDFEWGAQANCLLDPTVGEDCSEPVKSTTRADIVPGCLIGYAIVGSGSSAGVWPVISTCAPNSVMVHPHHHYFKRPAMKLIRDNTDVEVTVGNKLDVKTLDPNSVIRAIGARNNFATKILAKPVQNDKTNNTVHEKFGGSICAPLVLDNGNWEESNINDTLPPGEGVRTSKYTEDVLLERIAKLEKQLEDFYKEFKKDLA